MACMVEFFFLFSSKEKHIAILFGLLHSQLASVSFLFHPWTGEGMFKMYLCRHRSYSCVMWAAVILNRIPCTLNSNIPWSCHPPRAPSCSLSPVATALQPPYLGCLRSISPPPQRQNGHQRHSPVLLGNAFITMFCFMLLYLSADIWKIEFVDDLHEHGRSAKSVVMEPVPQHKGCEPKPPVKCKGRSAHSW